MNLPPVVLLSACDTHAYDASHASPVNAMLAAGATTVLGTSLPVDARYASVLIARMLLRLETYLPILLTRPPGLVRWSELFPGLQRMAFVSEAFRTLVEQKALHLSDDDLEEITFIANVAINSGDHRGAAWLEPVVIDVARRSGVSVIDVRRLLRERAWLTDALKYVQYGNPDRVLIANSTLPT
jgi:hypothetical protein